MITTQYFTLPNLYKQQTDMRKKLLFLSLVMLSVATRALTFTPHTNFATCGELLANKPSLHLNAMTDVSQTTPQGSAVNASNTKRSEEAKVFKLQFKIKNANSDKWEKKFSQEPQVTLWAFRKNTSSATPIELNVEKIGNDFVFKTPDDCNIDSEEIGKLILQASLEPMTTEDVDLRAYKYKEEIKDFSKDYTFEIDPLNWKNVKVGLNMSDNFDNESFTGYVQIDDDTYDVSSNEQLVLLMPQSEHTLNALVNSKHVLYDFGTPQKFTVNKDSQEVIYKINKADYAGVDIEVRDIDGKPAADFVLSNNTYLTGEYDIHNSVYTDSEGKASFYLAPNKVQNYTLMQSYKRNYKPYIFSNTDVKTVKQMTVDFSKLYHKAQVQVRLHDDMENVYYPNVMLQWTAEKPTPPKNDADDDDEDLGLEDYNKVCTLTLDLTKDENDSKLFTAFAYVPDGWMNGYAKVQDTENEMEALAITADANYSFDFSKYGHVTFKTPQISSGGFMLVAPKDGSAFIDDENPIIPEYYKPGVYKACVIGFQENGDQYFVECPSTEFTVAENGNQEVTLNAANAEDYVQVPLELKGAPDEINCINVSVVYDGAFPITIRNNGQSQTMMNMSFSKWKMLKGNYTYTLSYFRGNMPIAVEKLSGNFSVTGNGSVLPVDVSALHKFKSTKLVDTNGNDVNLEYPSAKIYRNGVVVCYTENLKYGLYLSNGEYTVEVKGYEGDNLVFYNAKLSVNDNAGEVATIKIEGNNTAVSEALASAKTVRLGAKIVDNGVEICGNNTDKVAVTIYTVSGQCIMTKQVTNGEIVSTVSLPQGTYIVRLQQGLNVSATKFVK